MTSTSERLKQILSERGLKQVDLIEKCKPWCEEYGQKLSKSDLSQFISGRSAPGQWKLTILAHALNVSEAWLMGLDVPMERSGEAPEQDLTDLQLELFNLIRSLDESQTRKALNIIKIVASE